MKKLVLEEKKEGGIEKPFRKKKNESKIKTREKNHGLIKRPISLDPFIKKKKGKKERERDSKRSALNA